jgi:integrase
MMWILRSTGLRPGAGKAARVWGGHPVPVPIMAELSQFLSRSGPGQERLFKDKFNARQWNKTCKDAGLNDLKFHDLRKSFCSILAQNGAYPKSD